MRRVCYSVAISLDGYLAGPKGETDWIVPDPDVDFMAMASEFDTLLVGRRTFDLMASAGRTSMPGMRTIVVSTTLRDVDHPGVSIIRDDVTARVAALRAGAGKDIWLFGGGVLFRSLVEAGLVDAVDVAILPVLLGGGTPLLPACQIRTSLDLVSHRVYKSGRVSLRYRVTAATRAE